MANDDRSDIIQRARLIAAHVTTAMHREPRSAEGACLNPSEAEEILVAALEIAEIARRPPDGVNSELRDRMNDIDPAILGFGAQRGEVSISLSELLKGGPDGDPPIEPRFTHE